MVDGQINRAVSSYLLTLSKNRGIPIFMDCSETTHFSTLVDSAILTVCNWIVFNESSIQSLLEILGEKELAAEWNRLSTPLYLFSHEVSANLIHSEDLKNKVENVMLVLKKRIIHTPNVTVLLSMQTWGEWISIINPNSISTTWIKTGSTNQYGSTVIASFESRCRL